MSTPEVAPFEYFDEPLERAMIAECGFRIAEYAQAEDIGTIVLVDKAARNLYIPIFEANRQLDNSAQPPSIYFLNPDGFFSPELHDEVEYIQRAAAGVAEANDIHLQDFLDHLTDSPRDIQRVIETGISDYMLDHLRGGRRDVARRLTPLADKVIKRDEKFNGRVLIMDTCIHGGTALDGITAALKDIGIVDVRTGVVNNIRNHTDWDPDFIVFDNSEAIDRCKPFGPQDGLRKGFGESMITWLGEQGLSAESKLARRELHRLMKDGRQLRKDFGADTDEQQPAATIAYMLEYLLKLAQGDVQADNRVQQTIGRIIMPLSKADK